MQWLLCLCSVIGFVYAQREPVCGLPADPRYQSKGNDVPFCVVLVGDVTSANSSVENNATYYTWYYPTVDEFSLFELDTSLFLYRNISHVYIEVGNYVSEPAQYSSNDEVVPSLHGYFTVIGGIVVEWVWDPNARELCTDDEPVLDRFCSNTRQSCYTEGSVDCDLQIYAGWSGTDVNDVFLQSRENLLSNYRRFSTAELYEKAAESAREQIDSIPPFPDLGDLIPDNFELP